MTLEVLTREGFKNLLSTKKKLKNIKHQIDDDCKDIQSWIDQVNMFKIKIQAFYF